MESSDPTERRKQRKLIMDNRKRSATKSSSNEDPAGKKGITHKRQRSFIESHNIVSDSANGENINVNNFQSNMPNQYVTSPMTSSNRIPLSNLTTAYDSRIKNISYPSSSGNYLYTRSNKSYLDSSIPILRRRISNATVRNIDNLSIGEDPIVGISTVYIDHGDQNVICQSCNAKLWRDESMRGNRVHEKDTYSLCCGYGKVQLPHLKMPESNYTTLFSGNGDRSKHFMKNIRRYNSMFSFTSMGGKVDSSINKGKAPFVFRLGGQNYHSIGSLLPSAGLAPKFSQLYIYDTENELSNRKRIFGNDKGHTSKSASNVVDDEIITYLKRMLDAQNELVKVYRMVRDTFLQNHASNLTLRLIGKRDKDGRTYNLPTASEVAALVVGDISDCIESRDIIVKTHSGHLQRISELHPSYLPLQYPLLFPFGDDGYRIDIRHRNVADSDTSKRSTCTMREFFAYRIQDRNNYFSTILNSGRLFQQFLVDAYTMVESERLLFIRNQQKVLRCQSFENLRNAQTNGNTDLSNTGQRVILPSSFTGGARYMLQNYLDAMTLCKTYGFPDMFITITCNPKWPEVKRFLRNTTLNAEDRPDILCRVFKIKLDSLIKDIKDNSLFGKVQAVVYTVEFQKRGLPHAHICVFLHGDSKLRTIDHIDPVISAEIPNKDEDPELYELVADFMIHGPCGPDNMNCPCMVDRKCSKNFPKKFRPYTSTGADGYPLYRRRNDGNFVTKSGVQLDNRSVVPYSKILLKKYQAHINVEWCNQAGSIKYLFKYINKGPDRVTISFVNGDGENDTVEQIDEIKEYYDCRYISACEATWRIFGYDVHYRTPPVMRLPFHLPDQQQVVYGADDDIDNVLNKPSVASSMFESWMACNEKYENARRLTYAEFPTEFVWKAKERCWKPRLKGFSLGRIHAISPSLGEAYFLRILLNKVKGPTSFEDIKTVNDHIYDTFRDACYALGLLDDDREYIECIKEAHFSGSGSYLRSLFVTLLMTHSLSQPVHVWEKTWQYLSDDILHKQREFLKSPDLSLSDDQIKNITLLEMEKILVRNNSSLREFTPMPYPDHESIDTANNVLIHEELSYNIGELQSEFQDLHDALTNEQKSIFDDIIQAVDLNNGGLFFVYGYGGTGKTFLWKTLSAAIRRRGDIVLNVASSGIASLLLTGGRTAHSRFIIPINLHEDSMCKILPDTDLARLLEITKLIIWDEAPMMHKHAFEALDRTLNDLFESGNRVVSSTSFGRKVVVFGGDFRQILPVIHNGSRQDIVNASLCSSYLWSKCKVLRLTQNMRLRRGNDPHSIEQTQLFSQWLLDLGEGKIGGPNDGEAIVDIPEDLLITNSCNPLSDLIDFVYPRLLDKLEDPQFFEERAILAPTNEVVEQINNQILAMIPGDERVYLSSDSVCETEYLNDVFDERLYSPEYLNGIKASGIPNHCLILKVGVPVMLLRNIDPKNGLCNGTRLQVVSLRNHVIEAKIISGSNIGEITYIPRLSLTPSDKRIPLQFKRRQFPIRVSFAMTINKSQGQSLKNVGLFLKEPVFTHGQLYVALSRVISRDGLKLVILDNENKITISTTNVVYKEVFRDL